MQNSWTSDNLFLKTSDMAAVALLQEAEAVVNLLFTPGKLCCCHVKLAATLGSTGTAEQHPAWAPWGSDVRKDMEELELPIPPCPAMLAATSVLGLCFLPTWYGRWFWITVLTVCCRSLGSLPVCCTDTCLFTPLQHVPQAKSTKTSAAELKGAAGWDRLVITEKNTWKKPLAN